MHGNAGSVASPRLGFRLVMDRPSSGRLAAQRVGLAAELAALLLMAASILLVEEVSLHVRRGCTKKTNTNTDAKTKCYD